MIGKRNPQIVAIPPPLFSWGVVKEALNSYPYERCIKIIRDIREAKEVLRTSLHYLVGEEYRAVQNRIRKLEEAENEAIKELREYIVKALANIIIDKLLNEEEEKK